MRYFFLTMLMSLLVCYASAQIPRDSTSVYIFSAEDILKQNTIQTDVEVSIASKRQQSLASAPAIVTVVTEREILQYGCRDISDILRLIPGFEFGIDVQSLFGLGFRGVWAHEGKALVMLNNTPINCFGYGNSNLIGAIPSAVIDRVEVIRGPGSTLYGGFAEVAVINIITKKGARLHGVEINTWGGALDSKNLLKGANLSMGISKDQLDFSFHVGTNSTPLSVREYQDYAGNSYKMGNQTSWRRWSHIMAEGQYKNFYFSYNRSEQNFLAQDVFGFVPAPITQGVYSNQLNFTVETMRAHYDFMLGKHIKIKPIIEIARGNPISTAVIPTVYPNQLPITYFNPADLWQNSTTYARRFQAEVEASYSPTIKDEFLVGIGSQLNTQQSVSSQGTNGLQTSQNIADTTSYVARNTVFAYAQYTRQNEKWGFTTGARVEDTPFGTALVPRLGITFVQNALNAKLLYGRAFRVPLLYQAFSRQYVSGSLIPEFTNTFDLEIGYKLAKQAYFRINAFHTQIDRPITYIGANNSYQNYGQLRSVGGEAEMKWQEKDYQCFANVAYSRPVKNFTSIDFMNQGQDAFLALPPLKINFGGSYTYKKITFGSTFTWLSKRHAQTQNSALNSTLQEVIFETNTHQSLLLWNANLLFSNLFNKKLSIRLTAYNLLNKPYTALQPYYGGHAPMPVHDRQIDLAITIKI